MFSCTRVRCWFSRESFRSPVNDSEFRKSYDVTRTMAGVLLDGHTALENGGYLCGANRDSDCCLRCNVNANLSRYDLFLGRWRVSSVLIIPRQGKKLCVCRGRGPAYLETCSGAIL